jgi:imidazole glycerol-phosphate synthase subunit HisF
MLRTRVIPSLLLHHGELVKTVRFAAEQYVGDPINAVRIFNEKAVDELAIFDIGVSAEGGEIDFALLRDIASQATMPLAYGGGVTSVADARQLVRMGFEKVSVSSAAIKRPPFISELALALGSQSVALCLDVKRSSRAVDGYDVFAGRGSAKVERGLVELCQAAQRGGVGEIIVNSIDRDGTMTGYDIELARLVRRSVRCPLTMLGGAASVNDIAELERAVGVVGAAAGSMFVFKGKNRAVLINYARPEPA